MNYYEKALSHKEDLVSDRRYFHTNAELDLDTPKARAYVMERLRSFGIDAKPCGKSGVMAEIGHGSKTILLRADMDALPMPEESGLPFACPTGERAHTCGHDFHAAMLLTAARLLKEDESHLNGTVRLMFQPGEETFRGSRDMIESGILDDPVPDAALAYHVGPGKLPVGYFMYNSDGVMMFSADGFTITVHGKGGHGAFPQNTIDPINIGAHIHLALQELIARESDPNCACTVTVGQFIAGSANNIIPDTAVLRGTIRCDDKDAREKLVRRVREISGSVAETFGGTAVTEFSSGVPPLVCNKEFTDTVVSYMKELPIPNLTPIAGIKASASEDFAVIAERIPSAFIYLSAGFEDERGDYPAHNPKVQFDENVLPIGAACMAHCARRWLEDN